MEIFTFYMVAIKYGRSRAREERLRNNKWTISVAIFFSVAKNFSWVLCVLFIFCVSRRQIPDMSVFLGAISVSGPYFVTFPTFAIVVVAFFQIATTFFTLAGKSPTNRVMIQQKI